MPIGKTGSEEFSHFRSVFDVIIKPAAEQAGYDVWRADDSAFTGNMTTEIVEALATADLVIADLTDRNPNVYLELGIRHCLRKSGTIHLIDADQALAFDVAGYRAIKYSTNFDKIDQVKEAIASAISEKHRKPDIADNPVHDAIELPQDYRSIAESEQVAELEGTQRQLAEMTRELEALRSRFLPDEAEGGKISVAPELLDEKTLARRLSKIATQIDDNALPGQLVVRAQQAATDGRLANLVTIVQKLVVNQFADSSELRAVAKIAGQAGLDELQMLVLEQAAARFPSDSKSRAAFAESCVHASDPSIQQRGKQILESDLGIDWEDGTPVFTKGALPGRDIRVGVLLDYYSSNDRTAEELAVALGALKVYGETPVTLRSAGRAHENQNDFDSAEEFYQRAVAADPDDDTSLYWFGNFRLRRGQLPEARLLHVRACEADPTDPRRVVSLLNVYIAEARGKMENGSIDVMRDLVALAVKRSNGSPGIRSECARKLNDAGFAEVARLCLEAAWPTEQVVEVAQETLLSLGSNGG